MAKYLFGDSDAAATRLKLVADVFRESSREFLSTAAASVTVGLAVDLGCGPGYTTRLIAETLPCDRVIGLEASEKFAAIARARATDRVSFELHDVRAVPFPCGLADLL